MERLTKRELAYSMGTQIVLCNHKESDCNDSCMYGRCEWNKKALRKLKEYEDAEEQGLLLRLPCKVGDTVWCLEEDGCVGYVFIAMSGEHYIVSADYVHCDDIYEQLEEMEDDTENGFEPSVYVFHKEKVFLTKEEAEQALAKMKEV